MQEQPPAPPSTDPPEPEAPSGLGASDPPEAATAPSPAPHPQAGYPGAYGYASVSAPTRPPLAGSPSPLGRHPFAVVEALLKAPASLLFEIRAGRGLGKLAALAMVTMLLTGLAVGAFSGGWQLLIVPAKVAGGMLFCALICLPSLYIFSALSGAEQSLRETWGALLMGVGLVGVLLVGLAPVSWVFSQATSSVAFMGGLHLAFLGLSLAFGIGLVRRVLAAANQRPVSGLYLWGFVFVLVVLQMTTSLRPLVGPFEGELIGDKTFFLTHWLQALGAS